MVKPFIDDDDFFAEYHRIMPVLSTTILILQKRNTSFKFLNSQDVVSKSVNNAISNNQVP